MNEIVLVHLNPHPIVSWGIIHPNGMFYYCWQVCQAKEKNIPVEKFNSGFMYFDILMKMRVKI